MEVLPEQHYAQRILHAMRSMIRAVDVYSRKLNAEWGLTAQQFFCLHALAEAEDAFEERTLTQIARSMNLGGSSVIGIIDRLEAKQLLRRVRSSMDRRKVYLELTQAGREIVQKAPPLLPAQFSVALAALEQEEQKTITESFERIVQLMSADPDW